MDLDLSGIDPQQLRCEWRVADAGVLDHFDPRAAIVFDIETGPLPDEILQQAIDPFPELEPFDELSVKTGNLKDKKKIADKIAAARASHVSDYEARKAKYYRDAVAKAALDPMLGQVLAIGYGNLRGQRVIHAAAEPDLLAELWQVFYAVAQQGGVLAGWNSHKFDLPFCRQRSFFHGLSVPAELIERGRYYNSQLVDLMAVWTGGAGYAGLDKVARFLGVGEKNGNGAEFARLWHEDREQAEQYLANDIAMTANVAARLGYQ